MSGKNSIQVAIKVRPIMRKEKDTPWRIVENSIQLIDVQTEPYYFDHIFDQNATNQIIFDKMAKQIVHAAVKGFNGTIFAYGQTSSGKTYTMMGDDENPGVMVLAAKEIFHQISNTSDRQFLLRVGYIEIYNEKIYDLLNKKNQDLKIHETSTGIVSVNCEEMIIQCEDDLLNHLIQGSKERTVGETNMNERSSRSHAIFRIIIESRKIDRSDGDDAVIQSVLNLVDLAGSERADQTGARGTRLKEGGHINKSLLFLSNVIKRLSENEDVDKYVSFRDSKLTRILQASLGGNALTSIICTIKPNAVEETQSTLNFALRAKSVKNKPQVNEIVSDATMMKRLEKEIKVLKTRLEEEQRKNQNQSQLKVRQLEQRIKMEDLKIISCSSLHSMRNREKRRRTWCPSTNLDASVIGQQPSALPVPTLMVPSSSGIPPPPTRLQVPKKTYYTTPLITLRPTEPPPAAPTAFGLPIPDNLPELDEEFSPAELVNFSLISPTNSPKHNFSITPTVREKKISLEQVENDLMELQCYTNLEKKKEVVHDSELALRQQVEALTKRNRLLEDERLEYLQLKDDYSVNSNNLIEFQKRCDELEVKLSKLTHANKLANDKIAKYDTELAELKKANEKLEMENREAVNLDFEFKSHKNKSKRRENELLEALNEKEQEINKLTKSLTSITQEKFQNSKNELLQLSLKEVALDNSEGEVCIKCVDLQRLLEENKKVTLEFKNLTLEYEKLKLSYKEIEKDNENNQLKIQQLEDLQKKEKLECEKLQLEVQTLREKLQHVQLQYEQLTTENCSKQAECMALNRQVEVAREDMLVLEEKFTKLELSWQEQQKLIKDIESQYAEVQTKYEHLQTQYEALETNRGQSQTDCQRLEQENIELQTEIGDLKKKVQDAQQKLLETKEKPEEEPSKDEQQTKETTKLQQDHQNLKQQLLEIQKQYEDLQKEYDDLSNQLMDNIQECDDLKQQNNNLQDKLKSLEDNKVDVCKAEAEINELKLQLEQVISGDRKSLLKTPSPGRNSSMRSSGVCVEEDEDNHYEEEKEEEQNLFKKFSDLAESFIEIELEHSNGKIKVFKSASKNSTPNNYKLYLKNILGVRQIQKDFQMEIENIHLQGSFKHHSFHIVELHKENLQTTSDMHVEEGDVNYTNGCADNNPNYVEKLKQEIEELYKINEQERHKNQSLLESSERDLMEMREQIQKLSDALTNNQHTIEVLEREKADITLVCEELQEKVNCTLNGSFNSLMNITTTGMGTADFNRFNTPEEKYKELENWKLKERELLETYDSHTKMLEDLTQKNLDMESELEELKEQLEMQERKNNQLQLEMIEKLELSASEYRDNMKKYNKEWEESRETYEETIQELKQKLQELKENEMNTTEGATQEKQLQEDNHGNEMDTTDKNLSVIATPSGREDNKQVMEIENESDMDMDISKELQNLQDFKGKVEIEIEENPQKEEESNLASIIKELENSEEFKVEQEVEDEISAEEPQEPLEHVFNSLEDHIDYLKQEQLMLKETKQCLETRVQTLEVELENLLQDSQIQIYNFKEELNNLKQENLTHCEEKTLLDSRLVVLEEHLKDAQELNKTMRDEIRLLETQVSDLQQDSNCIPIMHDKIQELSAEKEQLEQKLKLKEGKPGVETSIEEPLKDSNILSETVATLKQEKSLLDAKLLSLEDQLRQAQELHKLTKDENSLLKARVNDLEVDANSVSSLRENLEKFSAEKEQLQLEYKQVQQKLREAELQITEFCNEDASRADMMQLLENRLASLQPLEEEKLALMRELEAVQKEHRLVQESLETLKETQTMYEQENKTLKLENSTLDTKSNDLELEITKLKEEIKKFSQMELEKTELQQRLENLTTTITELELEKSKLQQEMENYSTSANDIVSDKSKLQQELENVLSKAEKMELENSELKHKLETLLTTITNLELEKSKLQQEMENYSTSSNDINSEKSKLQQQLENLSSKANKLELENSELQHKLENLSTTITELELEKPKLQQEMENYSSSTNDIVAEKSKLQQALEKVLNKTNNMELENSELKQQLKQLTTTINDLELEKSKLQQEIENNSISTNDIVSEKSKLQQELENVSTKANQMELENSELKDKLENLSTTISVLELEKSKLLQEIENYSSSTNAIVSEKSKLQQELENVSTKANQMELENSELKDKLENLSTTISVLELEKSKLLQEMENYSSSTNDINSEKSKLQQELEDLSTKANQMELDNSEIKQKLEIFSTTTTNLELQNSKLSEELQQLNKIYDLLKLEHEKLETQLRQLTEEKKALLEQTSILTEEKSTLEEQLKCLKEKEKAEELLEQMIQEKSDLTQNLRITNEKLQNTQHQLEEMEKEISLAKQEKHNLHHDLQTLQEEVKKVKDNATKEKHDLHQDLERLQEEIKKEKEKAKQEKHEVHQSLQSIKDSLTQQLEEIKIEKENTKQENGLLQTELETLKAKTKQEQLQQQDEISILKQETINLEENLQYLKVEKQNLQEKLEQYQHLQEDKSKLEATINALKTAQSGAFNILHQERDTLRSTLKQVEQENLQYKEKAETLHHKLETLSQQLHQSHSKIKAYDHLLLEHEEIEKSLNNVLKNNKNLEQQLMELNTQTIDYLSTIEKQSLRLENLHLELNKHKQAEQLLKTQLNDLNETLEKEKSSIQRLQQEHNSSLAELQLKYNSLLASNAQLEEFNKQLKKQHHGALENLNKSKSLQDELDVLKVKYVKLQNQMKDTVDEAGHCSQALRNDVEHHKQQLEKHLQIYNSLRSEMNTKEQTLKKEIDELRNTISTLENDKKSLEEKLRELTVRNFEQDLQRQTMDTFLATANNSFESNTSFSPRGRKSLERAGTIETKAANLSVEEKLMQQKNATTAERKNRRLSTHDERRKQSCWGVTHEKETMTDPVETHCKCTELDAKLKVCERNLFIKTSQVTALNMELKNHPLKDENAALMKRLQEEQDKSRIEIKRIKQKLYEQTAKAERAATLAAHAQAKSDHAAANAAAAASSTILSPAPPRIVADAETQTDSDINSILHRLQQKYTEVKNVCRYRLHVIKELEQKVSEKENSDTNAGLSACEASQLKDVINKNESLKNELNTVKDKYEKAKLLLTTRREEVLKLRAQLNQSQP